MKVENLKAGKRKLKPSMTRQLNELAGRIAGGEIKSREEMVEIKAISERLEGLKKKTWISWKSHGRCISKRKTLKCKYTWIFENRVSKNINLFYYLAI